MKTSMRLSAIAVAAALGGLASSAFAGGFGIGTQSGSGTGNAYAGGAAAADDASVAWYNPAAMMLLPSGKQIAGALHALRPSFKFQNTGSTGVFAAAGTGEGGDGGDWALVPNLFFTTDINPRWRFGLAVNAPFGLATEYDPGWRGRQTAIKSEIKSVNVNPSIAYKISDTVSLGVGVSAQKLEAELSSFSGVGALGNVTLNADDTSYGFNLGMLVQVSPSTRIGATYRSSISYDLEGTATFSGAAGGGFGGGIRAEVKVPDSASLSVVHTLDPKWELMGDITWTGWSSVQQLVVTRTTASAGGGVGTTLTTLPFLWKDTWRFGAGANYKVSDQTKIRFGLARDQTPTNDATRTPRLPDQDRTWIAIGAQHKLSKAGVLDVGYAHEFVRDAAVNVSVPPFPGRLIGSFNNKADIFSIQYSHSF